MACRYEGEFKVKCICEGANRGIHVGILNSLLELKEEKVFLKCEMHRVSVKDGNVLAFDFMTRFT